MEGIDISRLFETVAQIFSGLWPAFSIVTGIAVGIAVGIALIQYILRSIRIALDEPVDYSDKPQRKAKNDELLFEDEPPDPMEKPKRQFAALGDDGELIFEEDTNEGRHMHRIT